MILGSDGGHMANYHKSRVKTQKAQVKSRIKKSHKKFSKIKFTED